MPSTVNARTDDPLEVGHRIKQLREKRGLSMRQLAGDGCNPAYVSVLEAGTRNPSLDTLAYLADRLGTSARFLASGELEPWQQGLDDAGLELGDLTPHEIAVLQQNVADAERHAARILGETVLASRVDRARQLFREGQTIEDAAGAARCPLQNLHDAIDREDRVRHTAVVGLAEILERGKKRDATPLELAGEPDGVLESIANGDLSVTETTRQLARAELLDRKRKTER